MSHLKTQFCLETKSINRYCLATKQLNFISFFFNLWYVWNILFEDKKSFFSSFVVEFLFICLSLLLGAAAFILSLRASMYELFESSEASGSLFVNLTNGYDERSPCLQRIRIVSASSLISPSWNGLSHPKQVSRSSLSSSDACSLSLLATDLLEQALCSSLNVTFRFDMASQ